MLGDDNGAMFLFYLLDNSGCIGPKSRKRLNVFIQMYALHIIMARCNCVLYVVHKMIHIVKER